MIQLFVDNEMLELQYCLNFYLANKWNIVSA